MPRRVVYDMHMLKYLEACVPMLFLNVFFRKNNGWIETYPDGYTLKMLLVFFYLQY